MPNPGSSLTRISLGCGKDHCERVRELKQCQRGKLKTQAKVKLLRWWHWAAEGLTDKTLKKSSRETEMATEQQQNEPVPGSHGSWHPLASRRLLCACKVAVSLWIFSQVMRLSPVLPASGYKGQLSACKLCLIMPAECSVKVPKWRWWRGMNLPIDENDPS